ncbi:hypothetical protein ABEB36_007681 [Hypothenemus hampei]|uniref:Uncharacterized protein n=1 Tax=Hypothenemus hampei TaxID=57062 RepID=A0ABD1EVT7_HYPHA
MILQPCNVELTKIHYYDQSKRSRNMSVSTISREVYQNGFNKNMLIKKNVFGRKWVLKINEQMDEEPKKLHKSKLIIFICVSLFVCIILALCFGIIFSLDYNMFRAENKNTPKNVNNSRIQQPNITNTITDKESIHQVMSIPKLKTNTSETVIEYLAQSKGPKKQLMQPYCYNCSKDEVCIKIDEITKPNCVKMLDKRDPTGCGGLCKINVEFCKNLDKSFYVYQCLPLRNRLKCPEKMYNCETMCVSLEKRCDGKIDCTNMKDEENCECDLNVNFQCGNQISCLEKSKYCNGKVDCWDKSDEMDCQRDLFCTENHVPCMNGQCIPKEKMCDKVFDCLDKTDEPFWCQEIVRN